ncbi:DinB family protein [Fontibacillus phaseoli]|uniref:DinB family protein n=1 Tax=Fontibacillus phaseoli TaxID=1416533 RepID=A0A369BB07_9BACL|nr:DinB family protein [Fontibacillus phaseoli]
MTMQELKAKLDQSLQSLLQVTDGLEEDHLQQLSFPHPVFGLMDLKQWVEFVGVHEKCHLEQMKEVLREISA